MAAVLVDDRPAFGLGLALRKEGGRWGVVIPTAMPMATRFLPQNDDEWTILGAMAGSLRAGISDAHEDISRGSATDFDSAARLVGEKAGPPLFMCFVAYQRAIEARGSGG
jgi:hypothetical protein